MFLTQNIKLNKIYIKYLILYVYIIWQKQENKLLEKVQQKNI
jgi:hypothetical protein